MPRPRLHNTGLPERVYKHGNGYRYKPAVGKAIALGSDLAAALTKHAAIIEAERLSVTDSCAWLIDWYMANLATLAPDNAPRTIEDKLTDSAQLRSRIGHIPFREFRPMHVREYLDLGITEKRATRANREKALLSHIFSKARDKGFVDVNPCLKVTKNRERKADRYHEDGETLAVLNACNVQTWAVAMLIYRTLQRTNDVLAWTAANIIERDGKRILSFKQSKTGARVEIAITADIEDILAKLKTNRKIVGMTLVHNRRGQPYTENGIRAMWTAAKTRARKTMPIGDFGIYDMKAKGATEMYQSGVPIEKICALCGHDSVTTTETYIKQHLRQVIEPNSRQLTA